MSCPVCGHDGDTGYDGVRCIMCNVEGNSIDLDSRRDDNYEDDEEILF